MSRSWRIPELLFAVLLIAVLIPAAVQARSSGGSGGIGTSSGSDGGSPSGSDGGSGSGSGNGGGGGGAAGGRSSEGVFPIRGKHTYGDGLGAGRNHQGQDVFAKCGKRLVAAESGRVRYVKYQSSAGNYVVIKTKLHDEFYAHLKAPSKLSPGDRVRAGDTIGRVGETGNASGCHLHFEIWSKPGWYRGGSVIDPRPYLKRWDKTS